MRRAEDALDVQRRGARSSYYDLGAAFTRAGGGMELERRELGLGDEDGGCDKLHSKQLMLSGWSQPQNFAQCQRLSHECSLGVPSAESRI